MTDLPWTILDRKILTKALLFDLPTDFAISSNTMRSDWTPIYFSVVRSLEEREHQWREIKRYRVNGRMANIHGCVEDLEAWIRFSRGTMYV